MHDFQIVKLLNTINDLLKEAACLLLLNTTRRIDDIKQLPSRSILHYDEKLVRRFDHLVKLNNVLVSHEPQDMNLAGDTLDIDNVDDTPLLNHLRCYLFTGKNMHSQLHSAKSPLTDGVLEAIVTDELRTLVPPPPPTWDSQKSAASRALHATVLKLKS